MNRVREYREARYWSQEQLARESGLSHKTISRVELGSPHAATSRTQRRLADAFGVAVTELFPDDREPEQVSA